MPTDRPTWAEAVAHLVPPDQWTSDPWDSDAWLSGEVHDMRHDASCDVWEVNAVDGCVSLSVDSLNLAADHHDDIPETMARLVAAADAFNSLEVPDAG